jgi:RNA polymerase sigma factor (sigma-70 family)
MPATAELKNELDAQRSWLADQPPFQGDWNEGCAVITQTLDNWVAEYAKEITGSGISRKVANRSCMRLWSAWAYHWEQAKRRSSTGHADGLAVAEMVCEGVRPGTRHPMGGNPLRDAVLVETCLAGLDRALDRFFREYQPPCEEEFRRVFHRAADSQLWEDLFVKLVGPAPEVGKLMEFRGYSSLRSWLRTISRNFAMDRCRTEQIRRIAERKAATSTTSTKTKTTLDPLEWEETLRWCREQWVRALSSMKESERIALLLRFRYGWAANSIAASLKVSPGQVSRILGQATDRLRLQLENPLKDLLQEYDPTTLARLLFHGMEHLQHDELQIKSHTLTNALETLVSKTKPTPKKAKAPKKLAKTVKNIGSGKRLTEAGRLLVGKPQQDAARTSRAANRDSASGIQDLEQFLPEELVAAQVSDAPEDLFDQLEMKPAGERPAIVCLDARKETDLQRVIPWLERFDAVVSDQYEDESESPYEPQRVVVVGTRVIEPPDDWRNRADVDWLRTNKRDGDVLALYREDVLDDLRNFVEGNLADFVLRKPVGETRRLADLLPESKREAWKAWVKAFEERDDEA